MDADVAFALKLRYVFRSSTAINYMCFYNSADFPVHAILKLRRSEN